MKRKQHINKNKKISPNWEFWKSCETATLHEMTALSCNVEPSKINQASQCVINEYNLRLKEAILAVQNGELKTGNRHEQH